MEFSNILVPIDFSQPSRSALHLAARMAAPSGQLTLMAVNEHRMPPRWTEDNDEPRPVGDLYAQADEELKYRMRWVMEHELPEEVVARVLIREGHAAEEIIKQLKTGEYDLIVMGTHGRSGDERALVGSVTERVLSRSPVPMVITR